jgi:hypothetical protein
MSSRRMVFKTMDEFLISGLIHKTGNPFFNILLYLRRFLKNTLYLQSR